MAIRQTLQIGDPKLKARSALVTNFADQKIQNIITDLVDTMHAENLIGIAAPQIGENIHLFVTEPRETKTRPKDQTDTLRIFINPTIVTYSIDTSILYEGCGSVMHGQLFGPVKRPSMITIEAYDRDGKKFRFTADGILGRVIQHEYDHLFGIEFLEKITDYKKLMHIDWYLSQIKNSDEQKRASLITLKKFEDIITSHNTKVSLFYKK